MIPPLFRNCEQIFFYKPKEPLYCSLREVEFNIPSDDPSVKAKKIKKLVPHTEFADEGARERITNYSEDLFKPDLLDSIMKGSRRGNKDGVTSKETTPIVIPSPWKILEDVADGKILYEDIPHILGEAWQSFIKDYFQDLDFSELKSWTEKDFHGIEFLRVKFPKLIDGADLSACTLTECELPEQIDNSNLQGTQIKSSRAPNGLKIRNSNLPMFYIYNTKFGQSSTPGSQAHSLSITGSSNLNYLAIERSSFPGKVYFGRGLTGRIELEGCTFSGKMEAEATQPLLGKQNFYIGRLGNCLFERGSSLVNSDLRGTDLSGTDFERESSLTNIVFSRDSNLAQTTFDKGVVLKDVKFGRAELPKGSGLPLSIKIRQVFNNW